MKRILSVVISAAVVLSLAACTTMKVGTVEALRSAEAMGSAFNKKLTSEYTDMVNKLQEDRLHYTSSNALHFSRKGQAAAQDVTVVPEALADWDLNEKDRAEMTPARAELLDVLDRGGREMIPDTAAVAQARFDCWVMGQETDRGTLETKPVDADSCKSQFMAALETLEAGVPVKASVPAPAPVAAAPAQPEKFVIFFDWNKAQLSTNAKSILMGVKDVIASKKNVKQITITGHADTSGTDVYNDKLSLKRVAVTRDFLLSQKVAAESIDIEARGEKDPLVKTPDNVRQPENRRAQITITLE